MSQQPTNQRVEKSNHTDYSMSKIIQNTEKSPGNPRRLAITQPPVNNHQVKTGAKKN